MTCPSTSSQCVVDVCLDETVGSLRDKAALALGVHGEIQVKGGGRLGGPDTLIADTALHAMGELELTAGFPEIDTEAEYLAETFRLAVSPCGTRLACGEKAFVVSVWDTRTASLLWRSASDGGIRYSNTVVFSESGDMLLTTKLAQVILYDSANGGILHIFSHNTAVQDAAFLGANRVITACGEGVRILSSGGERVLFEGAALGVCVTESHIIAEVEGRLLVFARDTFAMLREIEGNGHGYLPVSAERDVVWCSAGAISVHSPATGECTGAAEAACLWVANIDVSKAGLIAACGGESVFLYDMHGVQRGVVCPCVGEAIYGLAFTPCGRWLFTGGYKKVRAVLCENVQAEKE